MPRTFAKGRGLPGQYRIEEKRYSAGQPVPKDAPEKDVKALTERGYIVDSAQAPAKEPAAKEPQPTQTGDDDEMIEALRAIGEKHGVSLARMTNVENMRAKLADADVDVDAELAE